jgi:D-alanyl-D-alanine carboxypeptidase
VALVATSLGALSALGAGAASAAPPDRAHAAADRLPAKVEAKLRQTVRRFQDINQAPGVLVGIWSPKGTFVSATGAADLATGAPLKPDMQFKIASQTKAFTANVILQLVGEGKVSFDDHVSKWVPGVPNGDQITIRQLLSMKSGLGPGFLAAAGSLEKLVVGCTEEDVLAAGASLPAMAAPGAKWIYSNYGYDLLGRVAEVATGQNVSTAIEQRIAKPLGLRRTSLPTSGTGLTAPFAHGYGPGEVESTRAPGVASDDLTPLHQSCLGASGGMVSTLEDLRVWAKAEATGALVKPAVWNEAKKGRFSYAFDDHYNGPGLWHQGLGFVESGGFFGKEGSLPGYESISMYSPSRRTTVVAMVTKQGNAITPTRLFQALAMDIYGKNIGFGISPAQAMAPTYTGH